ncbi:tetratricopeptide repeat protein [Tumebacillus lipolyticus]|uniref:Tetratricopeptide repeat protein n=1 Tax=Tumebacillus lipolyticus TaxID=1280370 RepID=A0ABW4ZYG2_9BACL
MDTVAVETYNEVVARNVKALRFDRGIAGINRFAELCKGYGLSRSTLYRIESEGYIGDVEQDKLDALASFFNIAPVAISETDERYNSLLGEIDERYRRFDVSEDTLLRIEELMRITFAFDAAGKIERKLRAPRECILTLLRKSASYMHRGIYKPSVCWLDYALELAIRSKDTLMIHQVKHDLAIAHLESGAYLKVIEMIIDDLNDKEVSSPDKSVKNFYILASCYVRLRNWQEAETCAFRALDHFGKSYRDDHLQARIYSLLGSMYRKWKKSDLAIDNLRRAIELSERAGDHVSSLFAHESMGEVLLECGDCESAQSWFEIAGRRAADLQREADALRLEFYRRSCSQPSEVDYVRMKEILQHLRENGLSSSYHSEMFKLLGQVAKRLQLLEEASSCLEEAISLLEA